MTKKNYGIEMLRILSMIMIVILHVLRRGGVMTHVVPGSPSEHLGYILEMATFCCVNTFAMISGYVMCTSKSRLSRILRLWLQAMFYSLAFLAVFYFLFPDRLHMGAIAESLFPVTMRQYWYIRAYIEMCILVPVLNAAIEHLEKRAFGGMLLGAFLLFSLVATIPTKAIYNLRSGENALWLSLMYLLGGYLKKYKVVEQCKASTGIWMYLLAVAATYGSKLLIGFVGTKFLGRQVYGETLMQLVSPTIVLASLGLFLFCTKLEIPAKLQKPVGFFAAGSLGVYLIHVNVFVWENWMFGSFAFLADLHPVLMGLGAIGCGLGIFLVCAIVDNLREWLFRLVRIPILCQKAENLVTKGIDKLFR